MNETDDLLEGVLSHLITFGVTLAAIGFGVLVQGEWQAGIIILAIGVVALIWPVRWVFCQGGRSSEQVL